MTNKHRIAVVLLNYNSEEDLFVSVEQIHRQQDIELITIVVDNASEPKTVNALHTWSKNFSSSAFSGTTEEVFDLIKNDKIEPHAFDTFFIYNHENKGYSAGNNIGIKLADYLNVDAVLIANPDMRFENEKYIYELSKTLFSNEKYFIAASKIVGLDGKDQSPLREASFYEELTWPRYLFPCVFKNTSFVLSYKKDRVVTVPKVMGCCLLLRMNFLKDINYFDENTFLYAEEPILSAQVKQHEGKIVFSPFIEAIHAHIKSTKGNSSKRMLLFIKSRKYYLKKYSGYNRVQLFVLNCSYAVLAILHKIKSKVKK